MKFSNINAQSLHSVQKALTIATHRKAMNQDSQTVASLLNDMKDTNSKIMESSVTPHKGSVIDVSV